MTSIGETLRQERLRRAVELEQISNELKISPRFLQAIESERFDDLPGGVFAKSFVRQYARYLGLDEEEFASAAERALEPPDLPSQPTESPRSALPEIALPRVKAWEGAGRPFSFSSSLPALAMVVVVMLVCSGVYSWWQRNRRAVSQHEPPAAAQVARVFPPPAEAGPPPAQPPTTEPSLPEPAAVQPQGSAERPAGTPPLTQPATLTAGAPASVAPASATPAPVAPAAAIPRGPVRLEITADEPVWVLARTNGKYLFSGTIDTNQTRIIDAAGPVLLRLGNAGGVRINLNGKSLGAVGPRGQVRTVQFTSGGFQIVPAPNPVVPLDPL